MQRLMTEETLEFSRRALEQDTETLALLERGLRAYANLLEAAALVRHPERLLANEIEWSRWDSELRTCAGRLGQVFLRACMEQMSQRGFSEEAPVQIGPTPEEAPETPKTVNPPQPEITSEVLARLQQSMSSRAFDQSPSKRQEGLDPSEIIDELKTRCHNLMEAFDNNNRDHLTLRAMLQQAAHPQLLAAMKVLDDDIRASWLKLVAALCHQFQTRYPAHERALRATFSHLNHFRHQHVSAYVHGLSRRHEPELGSWENDAGEAASALLNASRRHQRASSPAQEPQRIPEKALSANPCLPQHEALPEEWPFWPLTRGRRAVLVGSAGKPHNLEDIRAAFAFTEVTWVETSKGIRRVQALAQGIQPDDDRVFLIMHRAISHTAAGLIWSKRQLAIVIGVDTGFGITAVRNGIEQHGRAWLDRNAA